MIEFLIFILSLPVLYYGVKLLTDVAQGIAKAAGVSEFVIGATVVAFGTSLPELASSAFAMISGHPEIVVGNVIGSNLANIGLALGLCWHALSHLREQADNRHRHTLSPGLGRRQPRGLRGFERIFGLKA